MAAPEMGMLPMFAEVRIEAWQDEFHVQRNQQRQKVVAKHPKRELF
jgi:hypothetical protein